MATIQVRDVPDDVHRVYRERAAMAGMSLQAYLRVELVDGARHRTPAELAVEVDAEMRLDGIEGFSTSSAAATIRADRDAR
jgi:plasmid stability protein